MSTAEMIKRSRAPLPRKRYLRVKRALDLVMCLVALPFILIVGALCALAVRLDSRGPVLFAQERTGLGGRRFRMYKFRTMVANAEDLKSTLAHRSIVPPPDFKVLGDPRITRVGNLLRKTGLDELPQIINVINGTMSLVGPRPTSFDTSTYEQRHLGRLSVLPGVTGLWQVESRNSATFDERVAFDLRYIETMSFAGDVKILFRTITAVFRGEGA